METKREGIIYVISAPSGAGKTTLCKEVIDFFPNLRHSVSFTTRAMRAGEEEGKDYFFVAESEFRRMIAADEFAEWAEVHGNLYGTAFSTLESCCRNGTDVILDIDFQGARQIKKRFNKAVFIFILPPSFDELRRRLDFRNSDSAETIAIRLSAATAEMKESCWYDYIIVNDIFSKAADELKSVLVAEQCRTNRVLYRVEAILRN